MAREMLITMASLFESNLGHPDNLVGSFLLCVGNDRLLVKAADEPADEAHPQLISLRASIALALGSLLRARMIPAERARGLVPVLDAQLMERVLA